MRRDWMAGAMLLAACSAASGDGDGQNQLPTARILSPAGDTTIPVGGSVTFAGEGSDPDGSVAGHRWSFGNGATATEPAPSPVAYPAAGIFTASYRVVDNAGATSAAATRVVTVTDGAPPRNDALRFFANDYADGGRVKIAIDDPANALPGPPADIGATDFTIEVWLKGAASDNTEGAVTCGANVNWIEGNIVLDRDRYGQDRNFGLSIAGGRVVVGVSGDGTGARTLCGTSDVLDGAWHHVAVTRVRATGALALFVDGRREAAGSGPGGDVSYPDAGVPGDFCGGPCTRSDPFLVLGSEKHDVGPAYPGFNGELDELRLSTVVRYTADFTRPTGRFAPDGATAALYHFDEGSGTAIRDAMGASDGVLRPGGSPSGPLRLPSTAPTGS